MEGKARMNKGLLIGADSGIGRAIGLKVIDYPNDPGTMWHTPSKDTLNVKSTVQASEYVRRHGPYDKIVYSAGVNELEWIKNLGRNVSPVLADTFSVNVFGFIDLLSAHECWFPGRGGSIVAITSDAAERPMRGSTAYCASKAALNAAIRCSARELAPRWRVNGIAPGMTSDTEMTAKLDREIPRFRAWSAEQAREYELSQIPMGRRAFVSEVADLAVSVLNGPDYMTGSIVHINGGR